MTCHFDFDFTATDPRELVVKCSDFGIWVHQSCLKACENCQLIGKPWTRVDFYFVVVIPQSGIVYSIWAIFESWRQDVHSCISYLFNKYKDEYI